MNIELDMHNSDMWHDWQKASSFNFKKDDIFILGIDRQSSSDIYKVENVKPIYRGEIELSKYDSNDQSWEYAHCWPLRSEVFWIRPLKYNSNIHDFCICKRCNALNKWAAPNQKDGSYICFECR